MSMLLRAAAVVVPDAVLRPGWVHVEGTSIAAVGSGEVPAASQVVDLGDAVLVPGFVDIHCHGGGGAQFGDDAEAAAQAASLHLAHGTTTLIASLVSAPQDRLLREVAALEPLVQDGVLAGVHLEGPWLSAARCGAQDPAHLRAPAAGDVDALVREGVVAMVTLAPELEGGIDAVRRVAGRGAIAAIGHTDADHATARAAIAAGSRHATHLFNGMRPLGHRDPGPVLALLEDGCVTLELVRDGVHLDAALCRWLDSVVDDGRLVAITDAMAAAGAGDGRYLLGDRDVEVVEGVARLVDGGAIAGSTATSDAVFRHAAGPADAGLVDDAALLRAVRQTAANPASVLGRTDIGALEAGRRADVVVLSADGLDVQRVMRGGAWTA